MLELFSRLDQLPELHLERFGDALERMESRRPPTSLDVRDVRRLESGRIGQIVLGPSSFESSLANDRTEGLTKFVHDPFERTDAATLSELH